MKKLNINNFMYNTSLVLMLLRTYINNSIVGDYLEFFDMIVIPFIILLLIIKLLNSNYKFVELILMIICVLVSGITSLLTSKTILLVSFMGIITMKDANIDNSIKVLYKANKLLLLTYTIVYIINLLLFPDSITYNVFYLGNPRHSFYFNHPNMYSGLAFWTLTGYLFLNRKKLKASHYIVSLFLTLLICRFTYTRTMIISMVVMHILLFFSETKVISKFLSFMSKYGVLALSIFFYGIIKNYYKFVGFILNAINSIDSYLSHRIKIAVLVNKVYPITFLPRRVNYDLVFRWGNEFASKLILDNFYFQCFMVYGLLVLLLFVLLFYFGCKRITDNKDKVFITMIIITGIVESYMINCCICFPILLLGNELINRKKKHNKQYN